MRPLQLVLALVGVLCLTSIASAERFDFTFTGHITGSVPAAETTPQLQALVPGATFSGTFGWDFDGPPQGVTPTSTTYAGYSVGDYASSPTTFLALYYSITFETPAPFTVYGQRGGELTPAGQPTLRVLPGAVGLDRLNIADELPQSDIPLPGLDEILISLAFVDGYFASPTFPTDVDPRQLSAGSLFRLTIIPNPCSGACYDLSSVIDTVELVPEPSVWALFGLGVIVIAVGHRGRWSRVVRIPRMP